jgi:hypothetical protein
MKNFFVILLLLIIGSVSQTNAFSVTAINKTGLSFDVKIMYSFEGREVQTTVTVKKGTTKTVSSDKCGCIWISYHNPLGGSAGINGTVCTTVNDDSANVSITLTANSKGIVMEVTPTGFLKPAAHIFSTITLK